MTRWIQSCPVCGTDLMDDQYCEVCERHVSDQEITDHEAVWGDLWEGMHSGEAKTVVMTDIEWEE